MRRRAGGRRAATLLAATLLAACSGQRLGPARTTVPAAGALLPARLDDGLWLLAARVPGAAAEQLFLLDTGTDRTLLDTAFAARLGLQPQVVAAVVTAAGHSVPSTRLSPLPWLRLGDVEFGEVDVASIDMGTLADHGGLALAGIAGCDLFRQCLLELDYRARTVRVRPREQAPVTGGHQFAGRVPMVDATIAGTALRLLVDTGFQRGLALPATTSLPWSSPPRPASDLATLGGPVDRQRARAAGDLVIGELRWPDPWVTLAAGSAKLGAQMLRGCMLRLDAAAGRVWLER